ncbi:hypothetical protein GCM10010124_31610 [Pilimelia terevasa]|uniref:Uncharacterized protein n=1 Tax=Pilimelia terevasa TaxID=53372 RepID=A0A8J3BU28_9ACTN|nr:hypothetical protein [Pilimelia terevasa]GGK36650.1 hypothetical protein GCM10010124_31610 [Pilimelia terevasa]
MGERIMIGVAEPGGAFTAEYRQWGEGPEKTVPQLRRQLQEQFGGDAAAMYRREENSEWPLERGNIRASADPNYVFLYLIHVPATAVEVYTPNPLDRRGTTFEWILHSRYRLTASDDDMFALDGETVRCTNCDSVEVDFVTTSPSTTGLGEDTAIRCRNCAATETTTSAFTIGRRPPI